MERNTRCL